MALRDHADLVDGIDKVMLFLDDAIAQLTVAKRIVPSDPITADWRVRTVVDQLMLFATEATRLAEATKAKP